MMSYRPIAPAANHPVTLAAAKEFLRVLHDDEDATITSLIAAATSYAEAMTGRLLCEQSWELLLDAFSDTIPIEKGPVRSIVSVTYYDEAEALQTVDPANYAFDAAADPQWLVRATDYSWPATAPGINNVIIRFTAGYQEDDPQLDAVRLAILLLVSHWFRNREAVAVGAGANEIPLGVDALLRPLRTYYL